MNLYSSKPDPGGPLAPADWTMEVGMEGAGESLYYFADVRRQEIRLCRLAVAGKFSWEDEARRALAVKARLWIADFLARPESTDLA